MVRATVIFATHNGEKTLPAMLDALCAQTLPRADWKVVAVDNNSTDGTAAILESYKARLPLEMYHEAKPGKAMALDQGFRHLDGDLIIITDDDITPAPDWIEQFLAVADENPDYDLFSGLIQPNWETQPDQWILDWTWMNVLFALNETAEEGPVPAADIFGPNSAFRRRAVPETYSVHNSNIGPQASVKQYPMGGDTLFAKSIERRGFKAWHSRKPVVKHFIPSSYLNEDWILRRAERFGLGMPVVQSEQFGGRFTLAGYPIKMLARVALHSLIADRIRKGARSRKRFVFLWNYYLRKGILQGIRNQKKER